MKTNRPAIPLFKVFLAPEEDLIPRLRDVLYSGQISEGEPVYDFEREFSNFVGLPNILSFYSGTAALHSALILAGVQSGDEVIYGFWYIEKNADGKPFNWTRTKAGVYIYLNRDGRSATYHLACGAPLSRLQDKKQIVDIYWRGNFLKSLVFRDHGQYPLQIEDHKYSEGFLEFRVRPAFNLKRLGLGAETRDLGIQLSGGDQ